MRDSFNEDIEIAFTETQLVDFMVGTIGGIIKQYAMENETEWDEEHEPFGLRCDLYNHVCEVFEKERERRKYWKTIRAIWPNSKLRPKSWNGKIVEFIERWEHKYYCFVYVLGIRKDQILYKWKIKRRNLIDYLKG